MADNEAAVSSPKSNEVNGSSGNVKTLFTLEQWKALGHTARRKFCKKMRRHYKRSVIAQQRALEEEEEKSRLESEPGYWEELKKLEKQEEDAERKAEVERQYQHELWLRREMLAQVEFKKKKKQEEKVAAEKEEREKMIREEWEALQKKEWEEEEQKRKIKTAQEARLQEALTLDQQDTAGGEKPWHNPLAPDSDVPSHTSVGYGTEQDAVHCAFFLKTGACRFGDRCSKVHPRLASSTTLLIPHMFQDIALSQQVLEDKDTDVSLEFDEKDMYERFKQFYYDVLSEFEKVGTVWQFKVCCNEEQHLRGNVYVQFSSEEECSKAYQVFNGRWYSMRQLSCQFCPVKKWRTAICGQFLRNCCPKGKNCNFLHVFRNPNNAFWQADRDLIQERDTYRSYRDRRHSTRDGWRRRSPYDSSRSSRSPWASVRSNRSPRASSRTCTTPQSHGREVRTSQESLERSERRRSRYSCHDPPRLEGESDSDGDQYSRHHSSDSHHRSRQSTKDTGKRKHHKKHKHHKKKSKHRKQSRLRSLSRSRSKSPSRSPSSTSPSQLNSRSRSRSNSRSQLHSKSISRSPSLSHSQDLMAGNTDPESMEVNEMSS